MIFLSRKTILQSALEYGSDVLGLDATFNVSYYKNVCLFAIVGRSNGGAMPLGYFVSSSKGEVAVTKGLQMFIEEVHIALREGGSLTNDEAYHPQAFCIDKDEAEHAAIRNVFPESTIILCHYHFMTLICNELKSLKYSLGSTSRKCAIDTVRRLSTATSDDEYHSALASLKNISSSFYNGYFAKNYLNERWKYAITEVNRKHLPLSVRRLCRANMLTEVSFKTLKYVIFGGLMNRRMDDLLYCIQFRLLPYFLTRHRAVLGQEPRFQVKLKVREEGQLLYR